MLKGRLESLMKLSFQGTKYCFKYILRFLKWLIWELIPLHLVVKKCFPNYKPDKKPSTIVVWLCIIYIGCYTFTAVRHAIRLDRAEYSYGNFTIQVASGVPFNVDVLKKIGEVKLPIQPEFTWPWKADAMIRSLFFPIKNFQTYAQNEGFETTDDFIRKDILLWKHKLNNANLFGANLAGTNLFGINLTGANLSGANLSKTNLSSAELSGADFTGTNLTGANLSGADLSGADLTGTNLSGANLSEAGLSNADLFGIDLSNAVLPHADLSGANLSGINLSGANLSGADLSGANLSTADLPGADLSSANLSWANLFGVDLSKANLFGADCFEANLSGSNLSRANLTITNFSGANLSRAKLYKSDLSGTVFSRADLHDLRNVKAKQLIKTTTLFSAKRLNEKIEKEIREKGYGELIDVDPSEKKEVIH